MVLIDWTAEFESWFDALEDRAGTDPDAGQVYRLVLRQLEYLAELTAAPSQDTVTLKRVRQSRTHTVWRLAHPYRPGVAVRTIVWFPDDIHAVIALFANNKAQMGDVFYSTVGTRADQAIDRYRRQVASETNEKNQEET